MRFAEKVCHCRLRCQRHILLDKLLDTVEGGLICPCGVSQKLKDRIEEEEEEEAG